MDDLYTLLPIAGIFVVFWLLIIRPAARRQKQVRELQQQLSPGDRVVTNGGIYGTIRRVEDDRFGLEVAAGVVLEVARGAVVGLIPTEDAAGDDVQQEQE